MDRREFLKHMAWASVALSLPPARGNSSSDDALFWVFIDANGAWDPNLFCDPHADDATLSPFTGGQLRTTSTTGLRYAPKEVASNGTTMPYTGYNNSSDFFETYQNQLLVLNGVNTETNAHLIGSMHVWSGRITAANPSLPALLSKIHNPEGPLSFLTTGGFDQTYGLIPATRIAEPAPILNLAVPNTFRANGSTIHDPAVFEKIQAARAARLDRLQTTQGSLLPSIRKTLLSLKDSYNSAASLKTLESILANSSMPDEPDTGNVLINQARIALCAMQAGLCQTVNLSMAGFDTHTNHDATHPNQLQSLFDVVDYVLTYADASIREKMVVVVGSDFGRTRYNEQAGKDHWPITSMMVLGNLIQSNGWGGRVLGGTSNPGASSGVNGLQAKRYVVSGDQLVETGQDNPEGTHIRPVHVHRALRQLAGIQDHELAQKYAVLRPGDYDLPIFPG